MNKRYDVYAQKVEGDERTAVRQLMGSISPMARFCLPRDLNYEMQTR